MNKLINNFNQADTSLVITSFPSKGNFNAVGWHSQKTLSQLSKLKKILVCAESDTTKKTELINENLLVVRAWQKSKISSLASLFNFIIRQDKISSILVQFEFNVFGGTIPNLFLLLLLFALKMLGKQITFELHQVIKDVGTLEKHVNIKNFFLKKFYNFGLLFYYLALGFVSKKVIVHEEELKNRLRNLIPLNKIEVLPISVNKREILPKNEAKNALKIAENKFTLLVFGFINGYKGIDWILRNNLLKNKSIELLIVGGENPYLKDKPHYQRFYASILREAKRHANVTLTGFVPEDKISLYFSAADLVIMPYEVFMSASGPLSLAIEHNKPLLLSEALVDYQKSEDFEKAMRLVNLKTDELFFKLDQTNLNVLVKKAMANNEFYSKLSGFSKTLSEARTLNHFSLKLYNLVSEQAKKHVYTYAKNLNENI